MGSLVPNHVVVVLQVPVVAKREQRRVAHCGELTTKGDLRIPLVGWIRGDSLQPGLGSKCVPGIGTGLASGHRENSEPGLIQHIRVEDMGPTSSAIDGMCAQVTAKTRQQTLLQDAGSE